MIDSFLFFFIESYIRLVEKVLLPLTIIQTYIKQTIYDNKNSSI